MIERTSNRRSDSLPISVEIDKKGGCGGSIEQPSAPPPTAFVNHPNVEQEHQNQVVQGNEKTNDVLEPNNARSINHNGAEMQAAEEDVYHQASQELASTQSYDAKVSQLTEEHQRFSLTKTEPLAPIEDCAEAHHYYHRTGLAFSTGHEMDRFRKEEHLMQVDCAVPPPPPSLLHPTPKIGNNDMMTAANLLDLQQAREDGIKPNDYSLRSIPLTLYRPPPSSQKHDDPSGYQQKINNDGANVDAVIGEDNYLLGLPSKTPSDQKDLEALFPSQMGDSEPQVHTFSEIHIGSKNGGAGKGGGNNNVTWRRKSQPAHAYAMHNLNIRNHNGDGHDGLQSPPSLMVTWPMMPPQMAHAHVLQQCHVHPHQHHHCHHQQPSMPIPPTEAPAPIANTTVEILNVNNNKNNECPHSGDPHSAVKQQLSRPIPSPSPLSQNLIDYLGGDLYRAVVAANPQHKTLYEWQARCLHADGHGLVLDNAKNLVYSAPTAGGKTLVAEILMLRALAHNKGRKVLFVLPYIAMCEEFAKKLSPLIKPLGLEVKHQYGGNYSRDPLGVETGIIVATIENANTMVNKLLESGQLVEELSCVVVDELHLLGDAERGYQLELLLTKLRYKSKCLEAKHAAAAKLENSLKKESLGGHEKVKEGYRQASTPLGPTNSHGLGTPLAVAMGQKNTMTNPTPSTTPLHTIATTTTNSTAGGNYKRIQIVAMSATLPNIHAVGQWLDAAVYTSHFRPVPLFRYLKVGNTVLGLPNQFEGGREREVGDIQSLPDSAVTCTANDHASQVRNDPQTSLIPVRILPPSPNDPNHVALLTDECMREGHSVLIFCGTIQSCVTEAQRLAKLITVPEESAMKNHAAKNYNNNNSNGQRDGSDDEDDDEDQFSREAIAFAIESNPLRAHSPLPALVRLGIAFHNSTLTRTERELIEGAYRRGHINVLCATSTLAAGVNLPARRVIFLHAYKGLPSNYLSTTAYRQMAGRAGRAGIDDRGEAYLIQSPQGTPPRKYMEELLKGKPGKVASCLLDGVKMERALLEVVASGAVASPEDINLYMQSLFAAAYAETKEQASHLTETVVNALKSLSENGKRLIDWVHDLQVYRATLTGQAIVATGLPHDEALKMKHYLEEASEEGYITKSDLHGCFLAAPAATDIKMDHARWENLCEIVGRLNGIDRKVAKRLDIDDGYIAALARRVTSMDAAREHRYRKFYVACILHQIVQETPLLEVSQNFKINSGKLLESLQQDSSMFAAKASAMCHRLGWTQLASALMEFSARIAQGAKQELMSLLTIKNVKTHVARLLFAAGLRDVEAVAAADLKTIEKALKKVKIFPREKSKEETNAIVRAKAREILKSAKKIVLKNAGARMKEEDVDTPGVPSATREDHQSQPAAKRVKMDQVPIDVSKKIAFSQGPDVPPLPADPPHGAGQQQQQQQKEPTAREEDTKEGTEKEIEEKEKAVLGTASTDNLLSQQHHIIEPALPLPFPSAISPVELKVPAPLLPKPVVVNDHGVDGGTKEQEETGNLEQQQQQQQPPPPPPQNPSTVDTLSPMDHNQTPPTTRSTDSKKPPDGLYFISETYRLENMIKLLKSVPRIGAQFVLVPATVCTSADAAYAAALAPKIGKKRKHSNKTVKTTQYPFLDPELDGDVVEHEDLHADATVHIDQKSPGDVVGIAVSWGPGGAAYIPLEDSAIIVRVAHLLFGSNKRIIWFGWKDQVAATRWLISTDRDNLNYPTLTGKHLSNNMIDSRIAAWMVHPDSDVPRDGIISPDDAGSALLPSEGRARAMHLATIAGAEKVYAWLLQGYETSEATAMTKAVCAGLVDKSKKRLTREQIQACHTAALSLAVGDEAMKRLEAHQDPRLVNALYDVEMPLVPILADMEEAGTGFDIERLNALHSSVDRGVQAVCKLTYKAAGRTFDLKSPAEVSKLLFNVLHLTPPPCAQKVRNAADGSVKVTLSSGKDVLAVMKDDHPVVTLIRSHRKLVHALGKISTMKEHAVKEQYKQRAMAGATAHKDRILVDVPAVVRVRSRFIHTGTATGRLAMEDFNLQNLARPFTYLDKSSSPQDGTIVGAVDVGITAEYVEKEANMRTVIVPCKRGRVMLSADFRQIELRLMAHFSGDLEVRALLADGADDPFKKLASRWKKVRLEEVTQKQRDETKQVVYALCYGMGAGHLADKLEITMQEADKLKRDFLSTYSGISGWIDRVKEACSKQLYVNTLAHRRRWLPGIQDADPSIRSKAERAAVNSVCQGSAADIAKIAMIKIAMQLEEQGLHQKSAMVLQIHDELLFEVDDDCVDKVARIVEAGMEGAACLDVPLRVQLRVGPSWGQLEKYTPVGCSLASPHLVMKK